MNNIVSPENVTEESSEETTLAKPFVKWVGGKRQLLPELEKRLPDRIERYYEPFLGGGALFFSVADRVDIAEISDINAELINCYKAIREDVDGLIEELKKHENTEEHFLEIRQADRFHKEYFWRWSPIQRAARFIYLNKTCFNGLYRVNSKGEFNVPFGNYPNPKIVDEENLRACHQVLSKRGLEIRAQGYSTSQAYLFAYAQQFETFVYLDPPYIPISISSNFTAYSKDGFGMEEQKKLVDYCKALDRNGIKFMQSNSNAPVVYELYKDFNIEEIEVQRNVGASVNSRKKVSEVIIRNYK